MNGYQLLFYAIYKWSESEYGAIPGEALRCGLFGQSLNTEC